MVPENIITWIALVAAGIAAGFVARIILQSTSDKRRQREATSAVETAERQAASLAHAVAGLSVAACTAQRHRAVQRHS